MDAHGGYEIVKKYMLIKLKYILSDNKNNILHLTLFSFPFF